MFSFCVVVLKPRYLALQKEEGDVYLRSKKEGLEGIMGGGGEITVCYGEGILLNALTGQCL